MADMKPIAALCTLLALSACTATPPESPDPALLKYAIVGTHATVEYTIETSTFSNNSACKVVPANAGTCTAHGLSLNFKN